MKPHENFQQLYLLKTPQGLEKKSWNGLQETRQSSWNPYVDFFWPKAPCHTITKPNIFGVSLTTIFL